ncbi:unnamed protein product [Symbiodinium natans]|uniref:Uncharacterized protein n=1 Tax=Symbiodinium natans TaxID=878477 RepID=A0A812PD56_9DINO|nr:unnamed protein product [Symbiodinium natans]
MFGMRWGVILSVILQAAELAAADGDSSMSAPVEGESREPWEPKALAGQPPPVDEQEAEIQKHRPPPIRTTGDGGGTRVTITPFARLLGSNLAGGDQSQEPWEPKALAGKPEEGWHSWRKSGHHSVDEAEDAEEQEPGVDEEEEEEEEAGIPSQRRTPSIRTMGDGGGTRFTTTPFASLKPTCMRLLGSNVIMSRPLFLLGIADVHFDVVVEANSNSVHDRSGDGAQEDGQEAEDPPAEEQDEAEDLPGEIQDPEPAAPAAHPHHGFAGWGWHPHRHGHHAHSLGQSNLQVKDEAHQSQAYWDTVHFMQLHRSDRKEDLMLVATSLLTGVAVVATLAECGAEDANTSAMLHGLKAVKYTPHMMGAQFNDKYSSFLSSLYVRDLDIIATQLGANAVRLSAPNFFLPDSGSWKPFLDECARRNLSVIPTFSIYDYLAEGLAASEMESLIQESLGLMRGHPWGCRGL